MPDGKCKEIITYIELSNFIKHQNEAELHQPGSASWVFKEITEH
jgi:hypothetical protein